MVDIIFNAPDLPALVKAAEAMGFYKTPEDKNAPPEAGIIFNGPIEGGGSWSYNFVGPVYTPTGKTILGGIDGKTEVPEMTPQTGLWGRIRHNGDPKWLPQLPKDSGITLYWYIPGDMETKTPGFWSADGKTPAPEWVGNIGTFL